MSKEATEIEVEVVEIDGVVPSAPRTRGDGEEPPEPRRDWRQWQGKVRQLDGRWWPLWVLLGIIALVLMLTVGLVLGVVFVIVRLCRKILRAVLG